jgi:Rap1a immunity proteins
MRRLIFMTALLASGAAVAADSSTFQLRDAQDLVTACSVPQDHALYANATGFCHGVLTGAYRYYESTVTVGNRFICPPSPVTTRAKVMNDFVAWAKSRPQYLKDPPLDTLFRYLAETYPCRK